MDDDLIDWRAELGVTELFVRHISASEFGSPPTPFALSISQAEGSVHQAASAAAVARRLPRDFHPFIGNVVAMAVCTATIVTALSAMPGFG